MKILKAFLFSALALLSVQTESQNLSDTSRIYGVTLDAVDHLGDIITSLSRLAKKPTVRIVYDKHAPASQYKSTNSQIHNVSNVMGCIADSYYMKDIPLDKYVQRVIDYVTTMGNDVDLWEFGNEVNGDWLGSRDSVLMKIDTAYSILKSLNKKTALTLYYNEGCFEDPNNEIFHWVNTYLPAGMKQGVDYVLVSYYEDDCNGLQPDWQRVFDSLHVLFPNSKLGIGECGTTNPYLKQSYMKRYYKMNITTPGYIGGYFWWYYKEDCVPCTQPLWGVLNGIWSGVDLNINLRNKIIRLGNNSFLSRPTGIINFELIKDANVDIRIYDVLGRELSNPLNGYQAAGKYNVKFDTSHIANGIYYLRCVAGNDIQAQKMVMVK